MSQRATKSIVVNASPEVVYAVVTDFSRYPQWVADLKSVNVLESSADGVGTLVEFRAAAFGRTTSYTLRYDYSKAPGTLSWTQASGDLTTQLDGSYTFSASGSGTSVQYDLEVDLLVPIPGFIKSRAAQRIQSQALSDLKRRAESLA